MRISDWSSDVCSSDLAPAPVRTAQLPPSSPSKPKAPEPTAKPAPAKTTAAKPPESRPPESRLPASRPALPKPASGGWRVQLGAFSAEARARALWTKLTAKVGGLPGYQPYILTRGRQTRLQAGPPAQHARPRPPSG